MLCPVCQPSRTLRLTTLENALPARVCPGCEGNWIRSEDYRTWRGRQAADLPMRPASGPAEPAADPPGFRRCPEDQRILARLRVGHGVPFTFEFCRGCEGMWFDRGEWAALVERNLHDDLLQMVFDDWQEAAARSQKGEDREDRFRRQLGEEDYEWVREIKAWLDRHPRRSELYAYLGFREVRRPPAG
ncbi:MAG TPA: zf-TFIIB domain-containing protein [Longimicrobiaceae bacterium]|nr:zf-TFIIB domain-containing protein [Longimicrobiaceae bacterium]